VEAAAFASRHDITPDDGLKEAATSSYGNGGKADWLSRGVQHPHRRAFPQLKRRIANIAKWTFLVNVGPLWRDIESSLAATPGLYCFVRLAYPVGVSTDVPAEVEYGVAAEGQLRVVVFANL
jgi:hypothetical protein